MSILGSREIAEVNLIYDYIICSYVMSRYVTISAKVPRELAEKLKEYGIKPGPVIREALERALRKKILESIDEELKGLVDEFSKIDDEEIAELIREDRDSR